MIFILIIVIVAVLSVKEEPYREIRCRKCQGRGRMDITVGMGQHGFLPAVVPPCPNCNGSGVERIGR